MISGLVNKARQLHADPVLRSWFAGRLTGRWPGEPAFTAHRPPYLMEYPPLAAEASSGNFSELANEEPDRPLEIQLAGRALILEPGDERALFERSFEDIEILLALHRFAWLPLLEREDNSAWVNAIWRAWADTYSRPSAHWAWHPYTAAERAINLLVFAERKGLPGPVDQTLAILAAHGPAIAERLEYFGDHHTSNHLANNGRGLFLLGLMLGLPDCADLGGRILLEEAKRIFSPSGMLREGSSHYQALLAANYGQCAQAAERFGRGEAGALNDIAGRARAAAACLMLPGGFPLVGDISPDLEPEILLKALSLEENKEAAPLAADGWHRLDIGNWSGLWHASPEGFSHMPGHGHQDCGGFELHYGDEPVFIDPGRGAYGEAGEAAHYRSARVHNTLQVDGADPFPPNKPYYDAVFRRHVSGAPPCVSRTENTLHLAHEGFNRLKGVSVVERDWAFSEDSMILRDRVEGRGRHGLSRLLVTPLNVMRDGDGLVLQGRKAAFRLKVDGAVDVKAMTRWRAYGRGEPVSAIRITNAASLPWSGQLTLEKR